MAHNLPPKVPNVTQNWHDFSHQKISSMEILATNNTTTPHDPSWVDEFLDFSSIRRRGHRRSISESIAFLEAPMMEECRRSSIAAGSGNAGEFESINDDKQGPSDQQLHQPKSEPEEVYSSCKSEEQNAQDATIDNSNEKIFDPKRIKRILANRQSAQRSRVRKLQYISELERSVNSLQAEVSVLSPRVAFLDHQRLVLNVDNSVLKQRIAALAQDKLFKDAHQEALKKEIERLRQIYYHQNLKKTENGTPNSPPRPAEEQLVN
ncbi:Basic leucine zipper 34 [Abeliophyllum distichum]|uniref:Basic leucine zipper 34 n=1 Tax=Abeliophyllum distichum TaxID=126358 RepID=A0ABD1PRR1_9LAMI